MQFAVVPGKPVEPFEIFVADAYLLRAANEIRARADQADAGIAMKRATIGAANRSSQWCRY
jgi:hypothetical protein